MACRCSAGGTSLLLQLPRLSASEGTSFAARLGRYPGCQLCTERPASPCLLTPQPSCLEHLWWHQNRLASDSISGAATAVACCPAQQRHCPMPGTGCAGRCSMPSCPKGGCVPQHLLRWGRGGRASPWHKTSPIPLPPPRPGCEQRPGLQGAVTAAAARWCEGSAKRQQPARSAGSISSGIGLALAVPHLARVSHSAAHVQTI